MDYNELLVYLEPSQSMRSVSLKSNAINLSIGAPDLDPPKQIFQILKDFLKTKNFKYFDPKGSNQARINLNQFLNLKSDNPSEQLSVVSGSKYGIYNALKCILNRGDRIGIFPPYWLGFSAINTIHEVQPIYFKPIIDNNSIHYNIENIIKTIEENKIRCLVINTPNNPTGQIFPLKILLEIVDYCLKFDIWVLIDEVYKDLVYSTYHDINVNRFKNVVRIGSLSKSFSIPSIRAGYVYGSKDFISRFNLLNQHTMTCVSSLSNFVFESIEIESFKRYSKKCAKIYKKRTETIIDKLDKKNYKSITPQSSFYVFTSTANHFSNGLEASKILEQRGVLTTPGIYYGEDFEHYIRLSATVNMDMIIAALNRF